MTIPAEILKKVKLLELRTRKMVNNQFAGEYHTQFKGQGMTFADFREYVPGDDVRNISWPLTARTGKPYIKKFDEERELTVVLAIDISGSTDFGSGENLKGEAMIHMAALIAFSAIKNKDQVGLILFSDQVEHFVPPSKGAGHVHRMMRDLYYFKPRSRHTRMSVGLEYLQGVLKKKAAVFVMSDFQDKDYEQSLKWLAKKHDVMAVVVQDPLETEIPDLGLIEIEDSETGEVILVDSSTSFFRAQFKEKFNQQREERKKSLKRSQVDFVEIHTQENYTDELIQHFRNRKRR